MTTQEFLETVAREAAEAAIEVVGREASSLARLRGTPLRQAIDGPREYAEEVAAQARGILSVLFLAACERAMRGCPPPGGLSEERLGEIVATREERRKKNGTAYGWGEKEIDGLLAELAISRRIIGDESISRGLLEATKRVGWKQGAEAQKELIRKRVKGEPTEERPMMCWVDGVPEWYVQCVAEAPLATPPEEGKKETPS